MNNKRKTRRLILLPVIAILLGLGGYAAYIRFFAETPAVEPDPQLYPIRGIDISAHNGDVDFNKVKADGYDFVILKTTEGTDFKDRKFIENLHNARRAGLKVGAYHFFRFDTDGTMQAINLMHSLRHHTLHLPAVIDIEEWGNPGVTETRDIIENLRKMISHLEYNDIPIILYSNKDGYNRFIRGNFDRYPLWISSFTVPDESIDWSIWQYSHSGKVDGVKSKVDLNTIKTDFYRLLK